MQKPFQRYRIEECLCFHFQHNGGVIQFSSSHAFVDIRKEYPAMRRPVLDREEGITRIFEITQNQNKSSDQSLKFGQDASLFHAGQR
jgi:hypothetical protein